MATDDEREALDQRRLRRFLVALPSPAPLISLKARVSSSVSLPSSRRSRFMPTEVAIIVAAIVTAFIIFGVVLAWAEAHTRDIRR